MDGHFVPNLTFGPFIVEAIRKLTPLPLDCHLMIEDPLTYGPRFAKAGADIVTFHVEVPGDHARVLDAIEGAGARAGMVVNPGTDARKLSPWLDRCAMVLIMSVWPGFGGQKFMPEVLEKIPVLKDELGYAGDVEIDGGISPLTAGAAKAAGGERPRGRERGVSGARPGGRDPGAPGGLGPSPVPPPLPGLMMGAFHGLAVAEEEEHPGRALDEVPLVRRAAPAEEARRDVRRLLGVPVPLQARRARADRVAPGRGVVRGDRDGAPDARPAASSAGTRTRSSGRGRSRAWTRRPSSATARLDGIGDRDRRARLQLRGRVDGRRGRDARDARRGARARAPGAARDRLDVGRRADAGGRALAHADGEDVARRSRGSARRGCRTCRCSPTRAPAA